VADSATSQEFCGTNMEVGGIAVYMLWSCCGIADQNCIYVIGSRLAKDFEVLAQRYGS
jgi:hypothetical protein